MPLDAAVLQQAKDDYDRRGFAVIKSFLSGDELRECQAQAHRYLAEVAPSKPDSEVPN